MQMSIHRALSELKTYRDKIEKATAATFVDFRAKGATNMNGKPVAEYEALLQGNYDKATSLIENMNKIKAAVDISNANTVRQVGTKHYTVTEILARKSLIDLQEQLLYRMKQQLSTAINKVNAQNNALPEKLDAHLTGLFGGKDKATADEIAAATKNYELKYESVLVDPIDLRKKIEALEEDISVFKTTVDYVLSESNATTMIDVELSNS